MSVSDNWPADIIPVLDAVQYVKNHPERFLLNGIPTGWAIANAIAEDALVLGATDVRVLNDEDWWLVFSNVDWLSVSCRCAAPPGRPSTDCWDFRNMP